MLVTILAKPIGPTPATQARGRSSRSESALRVVGFGVGVGVGVGGAVTVKFTRAGRCPPGS